MSHPIEEALSALLDDQLPLPDRRALEARLAKEPDLRRAFEALRRQRERLRAGVVPAPAGFADRLMDRLEGEVVPLAPRRWGRVEGALLGLAAAAAAVVLIWPKAPMEAPLPPPEAEVSAARAAPLPPPPPASAEPRAEVASLPPSEVEPEPAVQAALRWAKEERAAPSAAPGEPPPQAGSGEAPGDLAPAAGAPAVEGAGTPEERLVPGHQWRVKTSDPGALVRLQRLAARFGGSVSAPGGAEVGAGRLEAGSTPLVVEVPSDRLAEFGRELDRLGVVERTWDQSLFHGDRVPVGLVLELTDP